MIRLFRVSFPVSVIGLLASEALLVFSCLLVSAMLLAQDDLEIFLFYDNGLLRILLATASGLFGMYFQDLYREFRVRHRMLLLQRVIATVGTLFIVQALFGYVQPALMLPRWVILTAALFLVLVLPLWRLAYTGAIYKTLGSERVLFLGLNPLVREIAERVAERPELGFTIIGFLEDSVPVGETIGNAKVLGGLCALPEIVAELKPRRILVGLAEQRRVLPVSALLDLRFQGVRIEEATTLFELAFGRVPTRSLRPSQLIFSSELGPRDWNTRLQSLYSFVLALGGLIVASPVMLLVSIAVRLTSSGPILYRQTRVGLHGSHFTLYKFRSMIVNAEASTGAVWASRNDPRVTCIGSFLRRTRLDELPQLFNVLRGEMSIVGPRPERPEFVQTLSERIPFYRQRHCVKPGLTGWAQINYKYGDTIEDTIVKLEYDMYYIKNLSPSLDAYIMFHTLKVMLVSPSGQ